MLAGRRRRAHVSVAIGGEKIIWDNYFIIISPIPAGGGHVPD